MTIRCPNCESENIHSTGIVFTSYPSYSEYKCLNCYAIFKVCNNENSYGIDLTKTKDATQELRDNLIDSFVESGRELSYFYTKEGVEYSFLKCFDDKYYYVKASDYPSGYDDYLYIRIPATVKDRARELHEEIKKLKEVERKEADRN